VAIKQKIYKTTFKLRRGQSAEWESVNPKLSDGEPGFELDTFKLKIGDGKTYWRDLPYVASPTEQDGQTSNVKFVNSNTLPEIGEVDILYVIIDTKEIKVWSDGEYLLLNPQSNIDLSNYITNEQLKTELSKYITEERLSEFSKQFYTIEEVNGIVEELATNEELEDVVSAITNLNEVINSFSNTYLSKSEAKNTYLTQQDASEIYVDNVHLTTNYVSNQTLEAKNYVTEQELADKEYIPVTTAQELVKNEVETQIKELVTNPDLDYGEV
jgi:hypothetical protein